MNRYPGFPPSVSHTPTPHTPTPHCEAIQDLLADGGAEALSRDAEARRHVEECEACFQVFEALDILDAALDALPPVDAPDAAVERLLAHADLRAPVADSWRARWIHRWHELIASLTVQPMMASAVAAALVLTLGVSWFLLQGRMPRPAAQLAEAIAEAPRTSESPARQSAGGKADTSNLAASPAAPMEESELDAERKDGLVALGYVGDAADGDFAGGDVADRIASQDGKLREEKAQEELGRRLGAKKESVDELRANSEHRLAEDVILLDSDPLLDERAPLGKAKQAAKRVPVPDPSPAEPEPIALPSTEAPIDLPAADDLVFGVPEKKVDAELGPILQVGGDVQAPTKLETPEPDYPELARKARVQGVVILRIVVDTEGAVRRVEVLKGLPMGLSEAAEAAVRRWRFAPATLDGEPVVVDYNVTVNFRLPADEPETTPSPPPPPPPDDDANAPDELAAARDFFRERERTEGLQFQPASGYWANTYLPGDPGRRRLASRLAAASARVAAAHAAALPTAHPFDPPTRAALGVHLQGDRRAVRGETRMLVQVGLAATPRHAGRRPAMRTAVVVDRDMPGSWTPDDLRALRATVLALARMRETGDAFELWASGPHGGRQIAASDFRSGPLTVALDELFNAPAAPSPTPRFEPSLARIARLALESVASNDDDAPLGASLVLLVTPRSWEAAEQDELVRLAHAAAVGGAVVSTLGIGEQVDPARLEPPALAGQGRRWTLRAPSDAAGLVDRELTASSRTVARAVRLRIALAPGVRLVEVIDSERLDARRAERVRQAERAVDEHLARRLGITADRGDDEAGIQIVIPAFLAGDTHSILLDIVVPGPGPVAEVTARWKDLVELGNGEARAQLSLTPGDDPSRGPLERRLPFENQVLTDLLTSRLATALDTAGSALAAGRPADAERILHHQATLLAGLQRLAPDLAGLRRLDHDRALLTTYTGLLAQPREAAATLQLADSLRYAARRVGGWASVVEG